VLVHLDHKMLEGSIIVSREGEAMRNIIFAAHWTTFLGLSTAHRSWLLVLMQCVQKLVLSSVKW